MGGFCDGFNEQPHYGFPYEGGLPLCHDLLTIPGAVLSLPTRTLNGSNILLNSEHSIGLRKEGPRRQAQVVKVPESGGDDSFLLVVQPSQQQKVSIPRRVMQALCRSGVIAPCTAPPTPPASSIRSLTTTLPSQASRCSAKPLAAASHPPSTAPHSRPGLVLPSSYPPPTSIFATASSTVRGGGGVARAPMTATDGGKAVQLAGLMTARDQDGDKAVQLAGLMKELEAAREEAADLRARLPGLRQLSTDVEEKDASIKALQARLAEVEREREEGEKREAELRRDMALQLSEVKAQMERVVVSERAAKETARALELELQTAKDQAESLERAVWEQPGQMLSQEREHEQEIEKLKREHEEAHARALAAVEERHAVAMAEQRQAHDKEELRLKGKLASMDAETDRLAVQLHELTEREWVEVVPRPAQAPVDAAEGGREGSN